MNYLLKKRDNKSLVGPRQPKVLLEYTGVTSIRIQEIQEAYLNWDYSFCEKHLSLKAGPFRELHYALRLTWYKLRLITKLDRELKQYACLLWKMCLDLDEQVEYQKLMDYKVDESDFKFAIYVDNKVDVGKSYI